MKYNDISLPYPVLGVNDDIYPLLEDDCIQIGSPIKSAKDYVFEVKLSHQNEEIRQLVNEGFADYVCEVSCKETFLRKCFTSQHPFFKINLARRDVNGRINFNCFIAVKKTIVAYTNKGFNEDYSGFSFDLSKGDLLAVFPAASYNASIKYDKLFAAGSFMQIIEASDDVDKTWFNLEEDRIYIELPHVLFEQYRKIGNQFPEIVHSSLVHNALVYALSNLKSYEDSGKLWADSLMQRMAEPELQPYSELDDMFNVFKAADIILQDPYKRLLDSMEKINDNLKEED